MNKIANQRSDHDRTIKPPDRSSATPFGDLEGRGKTMKEVPACPKCKGEMIQGFIPGYGQGDRSYVSGWLEGQPQKSIWRGTKGSFEEVIPIGAFRCKGCGFLEFYSDEKFASQ